MIDNEELYALFRRRVGGGAVSQKQIEEAVKKYFIENPISVTLEYDETKQLIRNKAGALKYNEQTQTVSY